MWAMCPVPQSLYLCREARLHGGQLLGRPPGRARAPRALFRERARVACLCAVQARHHNLVRPDPSRLHASPCAGMERACMGACEETQNLEP